MKGLCSTAMPSRSLVPARCHLIKGGTLRVNYSVGARALSSTTATAFVMFMYLPEEILRA